VASRGGEGALELEGDLGLEVGKLAMRHWGFIDQSCGVLWTAGCVSSIGQGRCGASLDVAEIARPTAFSILKLDPITPNVVGHHEPPTQGTVTVIRSQDAQETDLDLGHFDESFTDTAMSRSKQRGDHRPRFYQAGDSTGNAAGDYNAARQVIPPQSREIPRAHHRVAARQWVDLVNHRTIGRHGGRHRIAAISGKQSRDSRGDGGARRGFWPMCTYTLLPYIGTSVEIKTKPTQHSVRNLRSSHPTPICCVALLTGRSPKAQAKIGELSCGCSWHARDPRLP